MGMTTNADIAHSRVSDIQAQKDEYRDELHHEQQRMDQTQESALNYTTRVSQSDAITQNMSPQAGAASDNSAMYIESLGTDPLSLQDILSLIASGKVNKDTVITIGGYQYYADEVPQLAPYFNSQS